MSSSVETGSEAKRHWALQQAVSNRCEEELQQPQGAKEKDRMLVSRGSSGSCKQKLLVATAADLEQHGERV